MNEKKVNKVYLYGFDGQHQLQGKPWNIWGDWVTIENIHEAAHRMLRTYMNTKEVIVVDSTYETGREYKDLTRKKNWTDMMEHINFYDYLKSKPHFRFGLK